MMLGAVLYGITLVQLAQDGHSWLVLFVCTYYVVKLFLRYFSTLGWASLAAQTAGARGESHE